MVTTKKAFDFAREKHKGQVDDQGDDYFKAHCCKVAQILEQVNAKPEIVAAGYLHDTIEDTDTTYEELVSVFGKEIADLVYEVTHEGRADNKGYYFPRLKSKDAILIKFADRLSNLTRMQSWDEKRQEQYIRKSKFWSSF